MYSYMGVVNFAFKPKPILNISAKKAAMKAFNKKMGRIAKSGDMVSPNPDVRKTALANATKIKERMRLA